MVSHSPLKTLDNRMKIVSSMAVVDSLTRSLLPILVSITLLDLNFEHPGLLRLTPEVLLLAHQCLSFQTPLSLLKNNRTNIPYDSSDNSSTPSPPVPPPSPSSPRPHPPPEYNNTRSLAASPPRPCLREVPLPRTVCIRAGISIDRYPAVL